MFKKQEAFDLATELTQESFNLGAWATEVVYYKGHISFVATLKPLLLAKALFNLGFSKEQVEFHVVEYVDNGHTKEKLVLEIRFKEWE